MSTNETKNTVASEAPTGETTAASAKKEVSTLVDIIFDFGTEWATYGLGVAKSALEQGARTLEKLANSIESLKKQLATKA